jgi:chromosome segregation ATPase
LAPTHVQLELEQATTYEMDENGFDDDDILQSDASQLPGATIAAIEGVKDAVTDIDTTAMVNEESEFFITSRAKVSDAEIRRKREAEQRRSEKLQQKDELFRTQNALRKRQMSQGAALQLKKGQMKQIQTELNEKRDDFERLEETWKQRDEELRQKKLNFLKRIESMRHYEKQTQAQFQKYNKKADDEARQNKIKQEQKEQLSFEIDDLRQEKLMLEKQLSRYNYIYNCDTHH